MCYFCDTSVYTFDDYDGEDIIAEFNRQSVKELANDFQNTKVSINALKKMKLPKAVTKFKIFNGPTDSIDFFNKNNIDMSILDIQQVDVPGLRSSSFIKLDDILSSISRFSSNHAQILDVFDLYDNANREYLLNKITAHMTRRVDGLSSYLLQNLSSYVEDWAVDETSLNRYSKFNYVNIFRKKIILKTCRALDIDVSEKALEDYLKIFEESNIFEGYVWKDTFYAVRKPIRFVINSNQQFHYDQGAALEWKDGTKIFALNGVIIHNEELYWKTINKTITLDEVQKIPNSDVRAAIWGVLDPKLLLEHTKATLINTGTKGTRLYRIKRMPETQNVGYCILMECPSTSRQFLEWVDPNIGKKKDADLCQANAWGISKEMYLSMSAEG